ncbi:MAG: carboxypeptidase-like regulatory domain-containing protein [Planctomycetota bacterium]
MTETTWSHRRRTSVAIAILLLLCGLFLPWCSGTELDRPQDVERAEPRAQASAAVAEVGADASARAAATVRIAAGGDDRESGGTVEVDVVWGDGAPAAGVAVYVTSDLANAARLQDLAATTDERGHAVFAGVLAGPVTVRSDRAGQVSVVVRRGEVTRVRLQIAPGLDVAGRVVDGNGRAVPGAMIWLTRDRTGTWRSGRFAAVADAHGDFALRDVPADQSVGAVAAGFCPSEFVDLEVIDTSGPRVWVLLQLLAPGGSLVVDVIDRSGQPVVGALCAVGEVDPRVRTLTEDPRSPRASPTDASGRCVMAGMAPGAFPVEVMASGYAPWRGRVEIEVGRTSALHVELLDGASIVGTVRAVGGEPVRDVLVVALPNATPGNGSLGAQNSTTFSHPSAVTAADGGFALRQVPPGTVYLLARSEGRGSASGVRPWTESSIVAVAGETVRWDPVLDAGHAIQGVVRYRSGKAVESAELTLARPGARRSHRGFSDASGRFAFVCLEPEPYDLTIVVPDRYEEPIVRGGIVPSRGVVEVLVEDRPAATTRRGAVRGIVVDRASRLRAGTRPAALLHGHDGVSRSELDGGAFQFLDVEEGEYFVSICCGPDCVLRTDRFRLGPAQELALGELVTVPGASLTVELDRQPGTVSREVSVRIIIDAATGVQHMRGGVVAERATFENILPGHYGVELEGRTGVQQTNCASCRREVEVPSGGAATCTLVVRPAVLLPLAITFPAGHAIATIVCSDALGWSYSASPRRSRPDTAASSYSCSLSVPAGQLAIEVRTDKGGIGRATVVVADGVPPSAVAVRVQ